jgi:hypothetical protein
MLAALSSLPDFLSDREQDDNPATENAEPANAVEVINARLFITVSHIADRNISDSHRWSRF